MLEASEEEKQELEQAIESVKKMGFARDQRILALEDESQASAKERSVITKDLSDDAGRDEAKFYHG